MDVRVPTFHNLIQMELFFCSLKGKTWDKKWMWMLEMLQHSPNLQHLTLHQVLPVYLALLNPSPQILIPIFICLKLVVIYINIPMKH
jgi:hypothetical protein